MTSAAAPARQTWPLYDLFLDVPHPLASASCPKPFWIPSPIRDDTLMEELRKTIPQISSFAFPEHEQLQQQQQPPPQTYLNKHDYYATQNLAFSQFIFTLQLGSGVRLHGHVRRYLPPHLTARTRYDVGRRGERALVILTRASGADLLYASILKSVEAISSQQASMPHHLQAHAEPQKWFLHQLVQHQLHLAQVYNAKPSQEKGIPLVATLSGVELGIAWPEMGKVDTNRFILPTSLFTSSGESVAAHGSSSILPLVRCVGVAHALRILSALLSERRVIVVSQSPTRLAACCQSALSMLAQGLLHWQHLYIPVMPPHMWQYLAAPYPYLIGILSSTLPRLDRTDGLAEVLIIHLDTNSMETRGMDTNTIHERLPDLFQTVDTGKVGGAQQVIAPPAATPSEYLGQELVDILKSDKKTLYGDSTLANMGETAAKATKVVKSTFRMLRNKGRQYLQKGATTPPSSGAEQQEEDPGESPDTKSLAPDYVFTEACYNASAEQEARVAFTSFFLCMFGDMRWYLSTSPGQPVPVLDRERFLSQKRNMGEGEGTPIWPLLKNFCHTQMLEEFSKARIEEVRTRRPVTPDAPLFMQCASYHRQHNISFGLIQVRDVAKQLAASNHLRTSAVLQSNARRTVMVLTSNKNFEGDYSRTVAQLVEECRESTTVLFDVMSVLWLRLRDCRGMQWRHGFQALMILRNLLYHGPLAVIAEATDGLEKIRAMKYYDNMRPQIAAQVREAATDVYSLLVDRSQLFHIRRVCAHRRWQMRNRQQPMLQRNNALGIGVPFRNMHAALHPNARGTIVSLPPMQRGAPAPQAQPAVPPHQPAMANQFIGAVGQHMQQPVAAVSSAANEMMGLFDNMAVSVPAATAALNPFETTPATVPPPANPTIVAFPPAPPSHPNALQHAPNSGTAHPHAGYHAGHQQQHPPQQQQFPSAPAARQPNVNQFDPFAK